jgi:dolichyl-phosphate-mannose-protein mannosyltransferase
VKLPFEKREFAYVLGFLVAAFLVRFALFSMPGYTNDTNTYAYWFNTAAIHGPRVFYDVVFQEAGWIDYPPFNVYIFWLFGSIARTLSNFGIDAVGYAIKLPPNLFDMATAFIIFSFVRKRLSFNLALLAAALYVFNPAVIFNTAVWGQFDAIYTFFLVLSLVMVFESKPKLAVVAFMLGVLTKPQSIALAPLFFFILWRKTDWKVFFTSILVGVATVFAVILPFEWSNPVTFLSNLYFGAYNGYRYTSLNAFNVWAFGGMWVPDTQVTFILGWAMFAAAAAFAIYYVHKRFGADKELAVLLAAFLLFFAFFMLPTRIHERYLFPVFAVLALMFPFLKKTRLLYVALTITCFVNQAYVLSFLNAGTFIQLGDPVVLIVSLINLAAFLYVLVVMIQDLYKNRRVSTSPTKSEPSISGISQAELPVATTVTVEPPAPAVPQASTKEPRWSLSLPKLTKRDLITIVVLCIVFLSVATYNLGATQTPTTQTPLYDGQSFYLDVGSQSNVSSVHFLIHDGSYSVSLYTGSPGDWQVAASDVSFSDYCKWNGIGIHKTTQYIRVDVNSSTNAIIDEVAVSDTDNQQIPVQNIAGIDSVNANLQNLIDEQNKVQMPFTYMTQTYFDEIYFVRTAEQYLHLQSPYEWTHPPLGKLIQAGGIVLFGFNPFGWRIIGVIFATLMIPAIYLLGKKLFGTWIGAFASAFLLSFDFMHFTMGRMGTADTYVLFFSLLSQLFFFLYFSNIVKKGWRVSVVPLFLAVIFFMLGFSTKWLVLYGALGLVALLVALRIRDLRKLKAGLADKYSAFFDYPFLLLLGFIAVGIGIYFVTYIPDMLTGRPFITFPLTGPDDPGRGVVNLQFAMYNYHSTLVATHQFASAWWSWPIMVSTQGYVPLWLAVTYLPNSVNSTISAMGNPAIWWVSFAFMIVLTERAIRGEEHLAGLKKKLSKRFSKKRPALEPQAVTSPDISAMVSPESATQQPASESDIAAGFSETAKSASPSSSGRRWDLAAIFIVTVFFFSWIPYVFISRVTFIYHFYVSTPFLCLASAYFINKYWNTRWGKVGTIIYFAVVVAMFVLFYPVISGMPVSTDWIHSLKWFPSWFFAP